jgi:branched-chain amino acid transport system substrate-binding protein
MKKQLVWKAVALLTLVSVLVTACAPAATPAPTATPAEEATAEPQETVEPSQVASALPAEITIGAVHDLSGATAIYGTAIQKGIDLAIKQINENKVLGEGVTVKVVYEDAAGDPKQAIAAFEKLTADKNITAILGPTLSSEAKSADPVAQEAKVPVVASSNTASGITDIGDYIFRTSLPEDAVVPNTVKVTAAAFGLKKVAIMYGNDDAFTQSGYEVFKAALEEAKIEIVDTETFAKGDTDFSTQLTKIKGLNPDAIIVSALAEEAANIMIQARTLAIPDSVRIIGGNGFNSPKLAEIAGEAAEGAISGAAWNIASTFPANVEFVKAFQAEYSSDPDQFAAQAYTATWVLVMAIQNAGSVDRTAVRDALAQIKDDKALKSPLGLFSFNDKRDPVHEPVVLVVKDGKFEVFQP